METMQGMLASLLLCLLVLPQAGWRGIKPLHSTRKEVERLIGPPMEPGGRTYDLTNERVNVAYSDGVCTKGWPYGWDVPPGTVIGIIIYPHPAPTVADLKVDVSRLAKYVDPHGFVHFTSKEAGMSVETEANEKEVRSIEYFPAASDEHLRCPEAAKREREIERGESAYRLADISYYSDTSLKEQHVRLDYFAALVLQRANDSRVYIIGYAGQRARPGEEQARADEARAYLTKNGGVEGTRIVTVDGGHRDPAGVDLYIVERGQPKPLSSPNIYPGNVLIINNNNERGADLRRPF